MEKSSEFLIKLLEKRGIKSHAEISAFLNPSYEKDLHDPFLMRDMERACVRLYEAIDNNEKIIIYADYDCDGIPGAVILSDLLKKVGYQNFEVYIPGRNNEGYGLNLDAIKEFSKKNAKLLMTIDLGITAAEEITQAEVLGIDTIVMDHHIPPEVVPRAYAILNPKVDNYPEKNLCGAGVVFKFAQAYIRKYGELYKISKGWEKWLLDMAGLATLSDMVPLLGENRAIAYFGLKVIRKSPRAGLQKLMAKMKLEQKHLSEDDISFMITPKLNAASRMDDPHRAYELLSAENDTEAGMLADHLTKINDDRKLIVAGIMREVKKKIENREESKVIVIGNPAWRVGVLGLVAGKISDEYDKPAFVWGKDENDCIKGSCRSNGSISVVELMRETKDHFIEFGGHELAGGFTVLTEKVHFLEESLSASYVKIKTNPLLVEDGVGGGDFDIEGDLGLVNMKNWRELEKMAPFGTGNPKPVFLFRKVRIENIKKFGKNGSGEHLEILFIDARGHRARAISFFSGLDSFETKIEEGKSVDLYANFDLSRFRGREELRLRIISII